MRLSAEGNLGIGITNPQVRLEVDGLIRATQGIVFPDGTTQYSAASKTMGAKSSGPDQLPGGKHKFQTEAAGVGTQGRIAKWTDNIGTLGDTAVSESNGGVVIGVNGQPGSLQIFGSATADVFAGMGPDLVNGPAFNYGYAGASFGRSAGFFNVRPDGSAVAPNPSLRFATGNVQRMIIDNIGNVGIGTSNPQAPLDVAGAINTSTNAHRITVEEDKPSDERGSYLFPEGFGQPEEKGIKWMLNPMLTRKLEMEKGKANTARQN